VILGRGGRRDRLHHDRHDFYMGRPRWRRFNHREFQDEIEGSVYDMAWLLVGVGDLHEYEPRQLLRVG
jgi:hypothetical protein